MVQYTWFLWLTMTAFRMFFPHGTGVSPCAPIDFWSFAKSHAHEGEIGQIKTVQSQSYMYCIDVFLISNWFRHSVCLFSWGSPAIRNSIQNVFVLNIWTTLTNANISHQLSNTFWTGNQQDTKCFLMKVRISSTRRQRALSQPENVLKLVAQHQCFILSIVSF